MTLDKRQRENIRQLLIDEKFKDVWIVIKELVDNWKNEEVWGKDEFETIKNMALRDGKIQGVNQLMQNLDNSAFST